MLVECFSSWLLDKCPGFVIPAYLVLCSSGEEAVKHPPAALGKVNLQAEQGEHRDSSKREMWTHFARFIGTFGPAFPPLLPHPLNQTQPRAWGTILSGRFWSQQGPTVLP